MGKKKRKGKGSGKRKQARRDQQSGTRFIDIAIVAMLFLAIYFAVFGGEYSIFDLKRIEALERERAAELARTEAEIDSLAAVAEHLETDPEAIEREARESYGMIRDGEILYRFREAAPADSATATEDGEGGG